MSLFNHNIFDNVRTCVIVFHQCCLLLHPPPDTDSAWQLPGGGLEPNESLTECAVREVLEETGVPIRVTSVAFLREWVVPKYCTLPAEPQRIGFGLEVYLYAYPIEPLPALRPEHAAVPCPQWVPFHDIPQLPLWPKELKAFATTILSGTRVYGIPSFLGQMESPLTLPPASTFNVPIEI